MRQHTVSSPYRIKRVYQPADPDDHTRVLIDRLWPRGMTKQEAHVDQWLKALAPSAELRKWFGHDPKRWEEFRRRYRAELKANPDALDELRKLAENGKVTLLYAAHDDVHNNARVVEEYMHETGIGGPEKSAGEDHSKP